MIPAQHDYRSPRAPLVFKRDTDKRGPDGHRLLCRLTIWLLLSCEPLTPAAAYLLSVSLGYVDAAKWLASCLFAILLPLLLISAATQGVQPSRQNNKPVREG